MKYEEMSDEELMLMFGYQGDKKAWEELYTRHSGRTLAVCRRYYPQDPEDINQELWVKLDKICGKFLDSKGKFIVWLLRIAFNQCIDAYRKKARLKEDQTDWAEEEHTERLSQEAKQLEHIVEGSEEKAFQCAWSRLSAEDRKLLRQAYVDEMSLKDMAEEREVSIYILKKQLDQARERFRLNLSECGY